MEIYIIGTALVIVFLAVQFFIAERSAKKSLLMKIRNSFGKVPDREYSYEEFESITHYYRNRPVSENTVDDITWNDLDMDQIFMQMNDTYSSAGEEYLYYMLRNPAGSEDILLEREKLISYFAGHAAERERVQMVYGQIGRKKGLSISDYISRLKDVRRENNLNHYIIWIILILAAAVFCTSAALGMVAFIGVMAFAVVRYYRRKGEVEHYFICFRIINNIISNIGALKKCNLEILKPYIEEMDNAAKELRNIKKGVGILPNDNLGGSLADLVLDYVRILTHVDLIRFNNMLEIFIKKEDKLNIILDNTGMIEAMIAVASFRKSLGYYTLPDFCNEKRLNISELYHPVLEKPVANSIKETGCVLITGSNASGKSTFLRSAAINVILAQTIHTVAAKSYTACFFRVMSSMALKDNLLGNESYYIVEIKSLKRIIDAADGRFPVLCFVDEVLRGTNTVERIAASSQILKCLAGSNAICFAATHDIELTHILEGLYENYHFQEEVIENDIVFDYRLYKGRAASRNAIKLLDIMGYDSTVTDAAEKSAAYFLKEGKWQNIV